MPDYERLIERLEAMHDLRCTEGVDAIQSLEEALAAEREKGADAARFAEKAYKEVCAERDRLAAVLEGTKQELTDIHERLGVVEGIVKRSEGRSLNAVLEECVAALQHAQSRQGEDRG